MVSTSTVIIVASN